MMAKVTVQFPDDVMRKLDKLGKSSDKIVIDSLNAAGSPIKQEVLKHYDAIAGHPQIVKKNGRIYNYGSRMTGFLRRSIGISPVKPRRTGGYDIKVGFAKAREPKTGIRCGFLAAIIERGVLNGSRNQPPRPFIKPAEISAKDKAIKAYQEKFDEEVNKL